MIRHIELATENDPHKRKLSIHQNPDGNFLFLTESITQNNPDGTFDLGMMSCELTKVQVATLADVLQKLVSK